MKNTFKNNSKLKAGASITSTAVLLVGLGFPANSEGQNEPVPMTFDSVGSLLQDMDREGEVLQQGMTQCEAETLNRRLHDSYARLQERAVELSQGNTVVSDKVAVKRAHVAVKKAAKQLRVSMKMLRHQSDEMGMTERMAIAETATAALRAAEAALEIAP